MFWFKLWDPPPVQPNDPLVPLFAFMLSRKTFNRLGVGACLWEQFLKHCLNVDLNKADELNSFIDVNTYLQAIRVGAHLCGTDKLLHWYVADSGPHNFGPMGLATSTAPTVEAALQAWFQYSDITAPLLSVEVVKGASEVTVYLGEVRDMGPVQNLYLELCVLVTRRKLQEASNGTSHIRVCLAHQPVQPPEFYKRYFNLDLERGTRTALVFPAADLAIECENYAHLTYQKALDDCETLRENYKRRERVSQQVHQVLLDASRRNHFLTLDQVADRLHMSVRTLTRRLSEEQISFRELLSQVRLDLAKKQLQNTDLPIKTICTNAGFTNVSAFSRAFRKYMNVSPSSYRQGG